MREAWDMMLFVNGAYALTVVVTLGVIGWSWLAMRRAEKRREETRAK
ncbi:MAG: heme exporter protein CcmD [Alteraurantiacibacter sp.]